MQFGRTSNLIRVALVGAFLMTTTGCEGPIESARQEGYDEGYEQGKSDGYDEGFEVGKDEGYEEGKEEVLDCVASGYESADDAYYACS